MAGKDTASVPLPAILFYVSKRQADLSIEEKGRNGQAVRVWGNSRNILEEICFKYLTATNTATHFLHGVFLQPSRVWRENVGGCDVSQ
jgi:hypothetical protein